MTVERELRLAELPAVCWLSTCQTGVAGNRPSCGRRARRLSTRLRNHIVVIRRSRLGTVSETVRLMVPTSDVSRHRELSKQSPVGA